MQTDNQGFPQISAPFVMETGQINQTWLQLLINLWQRTGGGKGSEPNPVATVALGTSPFTYQAPIDGNLWVSPGCYCKLMLTRGAMTLNYGYITRGIFPMAVGDTITLTYTNYPPTLYFL